MGGKSHNTTSPRLLTLVYVEVTCVHMSEHAVNTKDIRFPHCECFYMLSMNDACVCACSCFPVCTEEMEEGEEKRLFRQLSSNRRMNVFPVLLRYATYDLTAHCYCDCAPSSTETIPMHSLDLLLFCLQKCQFSKA